MKTPHDCVKWATHASDSICRSLNHWSPVLRAACLSVEFGMECVCVCVPQSSMNVNEERKKNTSANLVGNVAYAEEKYAEKCAITIRWIYESFCHDLPHTQCFEATNADSGIVTKSSRIAPVRAERLMMAPKSAHESPLERALGIMWCLFSWLELVCWGALFISRLFRRLCLTSSNTTITTTTSDILIVMTRSNCIGYI